MSTQTLYYRFRLRRRTAAAWTSVNEILLDGELGVETDTRRAKLGNGATPWNALPYVFETGGGGSGNPWHVGSGVPSSGLGVDGDMYLNVDNGDLYQKTAGAWSVVANILGPPGSEGASAYDVAVANGFVGTEAEWLASLVSTVPGPAGPPGSGSFGTMGACFTMSELNTGGVSVAVRSNCAGTITSATLLAPPGETGSAIIDVQKVSYAGYSGSAVSICAGNKPTLSGSSKNENSLVGWDVNFIAGDIFIFILNNYSGVTGATLTLGVTKV